MQFTYLGASLKLLQGIPSKVIFFVWMLKKALRSKKEIKVGWFLKNSGNCQALVPNPLSPNPLGPAPTQSNPVQNPYQSQRDLGWHKNPFSYPISGRNTFHLEGIHSTSKKHTLLNSRLVHADNKFRYKTYFNSSFDFLLSCHDELYNFLMSLSVGKMLSD